MDELRISEKKIDQALVKVKKVNLSDQCQALGIEKSDNGWLFSFFNRKILFDSNQFASDDPGDVSLAVQLVLLTYINKCPKNRSPDSGKLVTIRELSGNSPLFDTFISNSCKTICTQFSGRIDQLKQKSFLLGGVLNDSTSYDLSIIFMALPKVPLILNFNDIDGPLPAQASFLFQETAQTYLDLTTLSVLITYLTGCLIQES